jgi:NDP-sugar pyrophosphorylase family protein
MTKNAMILAAGKGTRLKPLTDSKPKVLVEVNGVTMLERIIKNLLHYGFEKIIINVHHFAGQITDFLEKNNHFGTQIIISDETDQLLETGGGLKKAYPLFEPGQPVLVHNGDIITNLDLQKLYDFHLENKPIATLAVKDRPTSRSLLLDDKNELCGWKHNVTGETKISRKHPDELFPIGFSAIHVIDYQIFNKISETGVFSMTDVYLRLAGKHRILAYRHDESYWLDIGDHEKLQKAEEFLHHHENKNLFRKFC